MKFRGSSVAFKQQPSNLELGENGEMGKTRPCHLINQNHFPNFFDILEVK